MMPRLPVNRPRWGVAMMSPVGVTRFCSGIGYSLTPQPRNATPEQDCSLAPPLRGEGRGEGLVRSANADDDVRPVPPHPALRDLSPQAAIRFTHLENRLRYRDLDDPRFRKRLDVGC